MMMSIQIHGHAVPVQTKTNTHRWTRLEHIALRHPILATTAAMIFSAGFMVAAVTAFALVFLLPACFLAGLL